MEESFLQRLTRAITSPFHDFMDSAFERQSGGSLGGGVGGSAVGIITAPFRFLLGLAVFMIQAWAASRPTMAFVAGVPAIVAIAIFLLGIWASDFLETKRSFGVAVANYQKMAQGPGEEFAFLPVFAEKMVEIKPESDEMKYELGNAFVQAGNLPAALDMMNFLAPDNKPGYAEAHLWLARYYQGESSTLADPEAREAMVQTHLDHTIELSPDNIFAHFSQASIYDGRAQKFEKGSTERIENLEKAREHLEAMFEQGIANRMQLLALPKLVEIQKELLGEDATAGIMSFVVGNLAPITQRNPDVYEVWLMLVRCAVLLKDFDKANEFVNDGFRTTRSEEIKQRLADLASEVQLEEAAGFENLDQRSDFQGRLYAATRAIRFNPRNAKIYVYLLDFVAPKIDSAADNPDTPDDSDANDAASKEESGDDVPAVNSRWLNDALVDAPNPGVVHALLGLRAVLDEDSDAAKVHWSIAQQQFPLAQIVVNNMIDIGAKTKHRGFVNPLPLLDAALISFPEQPVLQQTHGLYLEKAGKTDEAIEAYEAALERLPNLLVARKRLESLYRSKGLVEKADEQKNLIGSALEKLKPEERETARKQLENME